MGWRTRVSNVRRRVGMTIENRLRKVQFHEPYCPSLTGDTCCCEPTEVTVSEYRYVPDLPTRVEPSGQVAFI
jgi:hypothetical protein